jgi:hypothetical protein
VRLNGPGPHAYELLTKPPWIFDGIADELVNAIKREADAVAEDTGWEVTYGPAAIIGGFAVSAQNRGIQLRSGRKYLNSTDDVYLVLSEFNQPLAIDQPSLYYYAPREINYVRQRRMALRRLLTIGWCWEIDGKVLPVDAAAAAVIHILLDGIEAGKNQPEPDYFEPDAG